MYQVNIQNQLFSAALPLKPLTVWAGSACSVTVAVPPAPAFAGLGVSGVGVSLSLPDGRTVSAAAVQVENTPLWVATFAADNFATSGHVAQGFMITVSGTDENGAARVWIIAKGDIDVKEGDAAPVSGGSYYAIKLREQAPENPAEGDSYISDGALLIYHDGEWVTIGASTDGKLDGAAAYPAWVEPDVEGQYSEGDIVSHNGRLWQVIRGVYGTEVPPAVDSGDWREVFIKDLKQDALGYTAENAANKKALTSTRPDNTNDYPTLQSVFDALALKANATDLPYSLVTATQTGDWQFSDGGQHVVEVVTDGTAWYLQMDYSTVADYDTEEEARAVKSFTSDGITATRAYALQDRAENIVSLSSGAPLQLPPRVPGKVRDLLVRLELAQNFSGSVDWIPPTGEQIVKETNDGTEPFPDDFSAAQTVWFSFTEGKYDATTKPPTSHWALSMKPLVAVTQAQGGS